MRHTISTTRIAAAVALLIAATACKDQASIARADTLQTKLSEQERLANQLASQKDSLTRVVLDADAFMGRMDSAITSVKGIGKAKRKETDPIADQLQARKDVLERVNALVGRAKQTASQLADAQRKAAVNDSANAQKNAAQAAKIEEDTQMIADLGTTIERQRTEITQLGARIDSLNTEVKVVEGKHYKAYYVIGTEQELIDKGLIQREGGVNLLFKKAGRTVVPARELNPTVFTAIDQRETKEIAVPDSTRRYRIVSRQSLDDANVEWRDQTTFKGNLKITKPDEFWASSRFLILVKM